MAETAGIGTKVRGRKRVDIKQKLLEVAVLIVGEGGYSASSIAKVTSMAGVAHGTFYNYFPSQQDLFDELLPHLGSQLLKQIKTAIGKEGDFWRREEIGFRTFFRFVQTYPQFYRILNEAETFAPAGYHQHIANMVAGYVRAVRRGVAEGALRPLDESQIEVVVYTLLAARNYLCMRYALSGPLPDFVTDTYMQLVRFGLTAQTGSNLAQMRAQPAPAIAREEPELIWNLRRTGELGGEEHFEGAISVGFGTGDIPRETSLVVDLARRIAASSTQNPDAGIRVISFNLTPGTAEAKAFSIVTGKVVDLGNDLRLLHAAADAADGGNILRATCVFRME